MIIINPRSRTPIFEQIKEQIINKINLGELKPDDKLPSIRQLASDLDLNVNTVKRAFQELEAERVTYSVAGKGVFVSEKAIKVIRMFYYVDISKITKLDLSIQTVKEISEFLDEYYDLYSGLYLKSKSFLKTFNN